MLLHLLSKYLFDIKLEKNIQQLFDEMVVRDIMSWSSIITAYFSVACLYNANLKSYQAEQAIANGVAAGQAIEPSCWIPILQGKHCILAGDHCQLAPVILSRKALEGGLGISLLERASTLHEGTLTTTLTILSSAHVVLATNTGAVVYLLKVYHLSQVGAANVVSIWYGVVNFIPIVGASVADASLRKFRTIAMASFGTLVGMVILTLTAWMLQLHPPKWTYDRKLQEMCDPPTSTQLSILIFGLSWLAIGTDGIRRVVGVVGYIIMPHNVFLYSALVQSRTIDPNKKVRVQEALNYYSIELLAAFLVSFMINLFVTTVSAKGFYDTKQTTSIGLVNAGQYVEEKYGGGLFPILERVAWTAAALIIVINGYLLVYFFPSEMKGPLLDFVACSCTVECDDADVVQSNVNKEPSLKNVLSDPLSVYLAH